MMCHNPGFGEASRMTQFKDKSSKQGADRFDKLLSIGGEKARAVAGATLADVPDRVGFLAPARNG